MFAASKTASLSGYQIQRSLRFNSADSAYLNRTPASAGNRKTWTWSAWVKRGDLGTGRALFSAGSGDGGTIRFQSTDTIRLYDYSGSAFSFDLTTTQVFRDSSAWYHFVFAYDSTQATASNRARFYVNGVEVTSFSSSTYPSLNQDTSRFNNNQAHGIGQDPWNASNYFNGYMTEVNFIDGQALTPSSFGQTNANTGVWEPKPYAGTYGTNGFYLNFSDNSNTTATTLGKDYSGNGNNWTPNNFSVSAGSGNDSLVDVPTPWGTDTGVGGTVRGNYCTLNPLDKYVDLPLSNGNLDLSTTLNWPSVRATFGMTSGKWYWENTISSGSHLMVGVATSSAALTTWIGNNAFGWSYYSFNGQKYNNSSGTSYGATWVAGDVIGVAFDADAGTLTFYKNGVSQGTAFTGLTSGPYFPAVGIDTNVSANTNFGQRPFAYTAPSGFKALCTQNLPTPTVGATASTQANKYFDATLFTGTGSPLTVVNAGGFQPDLVWTKNRSSVAQHYLTNVLSGVSQYLVSNDTSAEQTGTQLYTSFNSNGFSMGTSGYPSGAAVVAWQWKANGAGVTNTAGSITSTVSANTTSGFSVVTFTGTGANATVGHGLGAAPKMILFKVRNQADNWFVYHAAAGTNKYLLLNLTNAAITDTGIWQNTAPTSSVFSIGGSAFPNTWTEVAYCFAEVQGFSKFGSYTGNNSADGPFVFTGFRPAYVMIKSSTLGDGTANWVIKDKLRAAAYNPQDGNLYANLSGAEDTTSTVYIDFLSNGFKIRGNYAGINAVHTYIFAAFAEAPQKFALAR